MDKDIKNFKLFIDLVPLLTQKFLNKKIYREFAPDELNQTHIRTLIFIYFNEDMQMNEISNKLTLEKGSFTPVANKLLELNYIKKTASKNDKRKFYLSLTESGLNLVQSIKESYIYEFQKKLETLSDEDKTSLISSAETLLKIMKTIDD